MTVLISGSESDGTGLDRSSSRVRMRRLRARRSGPGVVGKPGMNGLSDIIERVTAFIDGSCMEPRIHGGPPILRANLLVYATLGKPHLLRTIESLYDLMFEPAEVEVWFHRRVGDASRCKRILALDGPDGRRAASARVAAR